MPLPGRLDITIYQGNSFFRDFLIENDIDGGTEPVDFTNHTVTGFVRSHPTSGRVLAIFDVDLPTEGEDLEGLFTVSLTPEETFRLPPACVYDIQSLNNDTGELRTWIYGSIKVIRQVTRG
jgi:hypothetical protein